MALLVFLARSARARIVAPHFGCGANRLWRFGLRRARLELQILLLALLPRLNLPRNRRVWCRRIASRLRAWGWAGTVRSLGRRTCRWSCCWPRLTLLGWAHEKQEAHRFGVDAVHHVFEKRERFALEFHERIFLSVAAQPDAFFQMIEREQMVFPLRIHDIEQDVPLEPAQRLRAEELFFLLVALAALSPSAHRQAGRDSDSAISTPAVFRSMPN